MSTGMDIDTSNFDSDILILADFVDFFYKMKLSTFGSLEMNKSRSHDLSTFHLF